MARKSRVRDVGVMADQKWQAESDLRTLLDACAIRKDKKRFAAAQSLAKVKLLETAQIASEDESGPEGKDDYKKR